MKEICATVCMTISLELPQTCVWAFCSHEMQKVLIEFCKAGFIWRFPDSGIREFRIWISRHDPTRVIDASGTETTVNNFITRESL